VTAVLPGIVQTEALDLIKNPVQKERFASMVQAIRPLQAADIANAIVMTNLQPEHVCIGELVIRPTDMPD
jgi:NADP-dependent 3-hydroxy acid dehydrogenase YdfG